MNIRPTVSHGFRGRSNSSGVGCTRWIGLFVVFIIGEAYTDNLRPITSYDLVNIRDIGGHNMTAANYRGALSVSPDGKFVAFQLQIPNVNARNYDLSWHIIEAKPGGKRWRVDDGGAIIHNPTGGPAPSGSRPPVEAQWSPDSEWIYYLKRVDGSTQLWRSHKYGDVNEQLTHNASDILSFRISDEGDRIVFTVAIPEEELSQRLQEEADRGFLYDERYHPYKQGMPMARTCSVDNEGEVFEVGIGRACVLPLWVYEVSAMTEHEATADETETYLQLSGAARSRLSGSDSFLLNERKDGAVIWLKNEDPEKFPGYRPPLRLFASLNGKDVRCNAIECHGVRGVIEKAWWRLGRDAIVFQRADGTNKSMTGLYAWSPGSEEVRTIIKTEDQLADCKILEDRAICMREQWTYPRTIVSLDLKSGEIETVYDPNPEFNTFQFSRIEKIEWKDKFGNPTHGHLVYPLNYEEGRRYPLVITTYISRGFLRGAVGDEYPIHVLAANGFMVLSHGMPSRPQWDSVKTSGWQSNFEDNYERRSTLSSQKKILDMLDKRGLIDPARVAITGLSDGEAQTIFALVHTDRFAVAIASSARDYRSSYYSMNQQERAFRREIFGGAPYEDRNGLYKALSIGLNAERVSAPFLINVSDHELIGSVESFVRLQDAGKPIEMYVFPNEYHNKWQPQHRLAIYRRNVQWLKFWLMGEEEGDAVSPGQYARWRKMRAERCAWDEPEDEKPSYCEYSNAVH